MLNRIPSMPSEIPTDDNQKTCDLLPGIARNVSFKASGKQLINSIDLTLTSDLITVIMGPNGSGKSLLLRLLHGMLKPSSGSILWGGQTLSKPVRKRQAMVFQRPVLLRRSVAANIDFVLKLRGKIQEKWRTDILRAVGLLDRANQPARLLSGGEQQRLALARALVLEPDILFLDEPTANLDPTSVALIEEIVLTAHKQGTKVIFVTHDIGQAKRLADDIIFLHRGAVFEHTPAEQFFKKPVSSQAANYLDGSLLI